MYVVVTLLLATIDVPALQAEIDAQGLAWQAGATPFATGDQTPPPLPADNPLDGLAELYPERARPGGSLLWQAGGAGSPYLNWANVSGANYMSGVRSQGDCGACFVFGSLSVVEALLAIELGEPRYDIDLSEQHALSCVDSGSCGGGGTAQAVASFLEDTGVVDEQCRPYQAVDNACGSDMCSDWQARITTIPDWSMSYLPWGEGDIKSAVADGPIAVNMQIYDDFYAYSSGVYSRTGSASSEGWHLVALVGWDNSDNSWIVKNSWGEDWGDDGYFKISRVDDCSNFFTTGVCFASNLVTFEVQASQAPAFACLDPWEPSISAPLDAGPQQQTITVRNCGASASLSWALESPPAGVSMSPSSGTLAVGMSATVTLGVEPSAFTIGSHSVPVVVVGQGGPATLEIALTIDPPLRPVVAFSATPDMGVAPLAVQFTNETVGQALGYSWDFGDGDSSIEESPQHTFTRGGSYTVTLVAHHAGGSESYVDDDCVLVGFPDGTPPPDPGVDDGGVDGGCAATPSGLALLGLLLLRRRRR